MAQLQNWPLVVVEADLTMGPPNAPGDSRVSLETNGVAIQQLSTQRGTQYELGHAESGTCNITVSDPNEVMNPVNPASPFNSNGNTLLPYRAVQTVAWWNKTTKTPTTGNLLNSTNNISGTNTPIDPSFESGVSGWFNFGTSATVAQSTTQAFDGTHSVSVTLTGGSDTAIVGLRTIAGQQQTASIYVFAPASTTVTASFLNYPSQTVIASATTTTTGTWQRLTMTGTPTGFSTILKVTAAGTFPLTFFLDAMQLELGASVTAFTQIGPTRNAIFTGFIERYPSTWTDSGFRGVRPLVAVDALSILSRTVISQSYQNTIMADGPSLVMPLHDQSAPQAVTLPKGGQPFLGFTQLGSQSGAVNFGGDSFLDGTSAVTVVQQNTNPTTNSDNTMVTYLGTVQGSYVMNPQSFTIELWAKVSSGTPYFGAAAMAPGESTVGEVTGPNNWLGWYTSQGATTVYYKDPNQNTVFNNNFSTTGVPTYPDGQWHYWNIVFNGSNQYTFQQDNHVSTVHTFAASPSTAVQLNNFFVESTTYFGDALTQIAVANVAVYPTHLTSSQVTNHYQRGIGYIGEIAGTRAGRLLSQYWGNSLTYKVGGGYIGLSADYDYNTRLMLDVLNEMADTEGGRFFADRNGLAVFEDRSSRYVLANQTPVATFGESSGTGELPYEDVEYDFDPTYVFSQASLTRPGNSNIAPVVNSTSLANYGQRIIQQDVKVTNDFDVAQAANFYLSRYATPKMRVRKLTINPGANPDLFATALALDISQRVTVTRRTSSGTVISGDFYVEQVNHNIDAAAHTWTVDLQLSPVFVPRALTLGDSAYGVLGSSAGNAVIY